MAPQPTVIFVHGAFCGGWAFDRFKAPFASAGLRCLTPDLPGHAPDDGADGVRGRSMTDYAAAIATLAAQQAEPPVLVGHSLGGLVAQMAATQAKVRALVLLAPSPPWGVAGGSLEEAISAVSLYALGPFWSLAIDPDFGPASAYTFDRLPRAEQKAVFARMAPESGRALWETLNWWLDPLMTTSVASSAVGAPVLAIVGAEDRIHPPATVTQVAQRLGGECRVLDSMSHWLVAEPGWEAAADACVEWLALAETPLP